EVPLEEVARTVAVDEAEALEFYQQNRSQFTTPAGPEGGEAAPQPYAQVRDRVMTRLRRQKADEKAQQIVRTAQNLLREDEAVRRLLQEGAYRAVPVDFAPLPLDQVVRTLEERFGVRPRVQRMTDAWQTVNDLETLPGIGGAASAARQQVGLADYVQSA